MNIKNNLHKLLVFINNYLFDLFLYEKNKLGKSVFLFSDSRGSEIDSFYKQKNPFFSYISSKEFKGYDISYHLCPKKFTSIIDFLENYESASNYDVIVLHCGIVDFAPRPLSSYESMLASKRSYLVSKGWYKYFTDRQDYSCCYEGEKTLSFFSEDFFKEIIVPKLKEIENLIYVGLNPVLLDWRGDYWRDRPSCINEQLSFDKILQLELNNTIDISSWTEAQIKKFTVDNVHYNKTGMDYFSKEIVEIIKLMKLKEN
ncbi:hypothetical protein AB6C44_09970 [Vibrio splendidus]